jgi:hypothetical protein
MSEGFERAAPVVIGRKPRDQVEQQFLAQIIEILVGKTKPMAHTARNAISHALENGKIFGGNGAAHRQDLDSSFSMNRWSAIMAGETSSEPARKLPATCPAGI